MTTVPLSLWVPFLGLTGLLLALDLGVFNRDNKTPSLRKSVAWTVFYVALAVLFGLALPGFHPRGEDAAMEFFTAYALEKTLSFDNIFVMSLIFGALAIPPKFQHRVLFWGIIGVIFMRGAFIAAGAAIVSQFIWILAGFGAFLIYTGIKTFFIEGEKEVDLEKNKVLKFLRQYFHITPVVPAHGAFFMLMPIQKNPWNAKVHVRAATPLFVALVLVECADLVFALDSIPAAFAVTQDAFVIFTANLFAIFGLRSLYFVLLTMLDKFQYLGKAVSIVLCFIGVKILLQMPWPGWLPLHYHIDPETSMFLVLGTLMSGVFISIITRPPE